MDRTLPDKIKWAKDIGFSEVGFTSNCGLLKKKMAERLLDAGLDCIIPSIDGTTKEVHEEIRPRTNFDRIVSNVKYFVEYRDKHDYNCKVLIRMVKQQLNYKQWDEYRKFWSEVLDPEKGDAVLGINVHNTGGKVPDYENKRVNAFDDDVAAFERDYVDKKVGKCADLYERLSIFTSGDVALCSADQASYYQLGNVLDKDPIDVFNNKIFRHYREKWDNGEYKSLDYCKNCVIPISRYHKTRSGLA
jgi:MoaA/NifB/PqqE/SkfB family radical SAM enzyme